MSGEEAIKILKKLNKRFTCAQLAREMGVGYLTAWRWLNGSTTPRSLIVIDHIAAVAKKLRV